MKVNMENETESVAYFQYIIELKINYQKQDIINELFPACSYTTDNRW